MEYKGIILHEDREFPGTYFILLTNGSKVYGGVDALKDAIDQAELGAKDTI